MNCASLTGFSTACAWASAQATLCLWCALQFGDCNTTDSGCSARLLLVCAEQFLPRRHRPCLPRRVDGQCLYWGATRSLQQVALSHRQFVQCVSPHGGVVGFKWRPQSASRLCLRHLTSSVLTATCRHEAGPRVLAAITTPKMARTSWLDSVALAGVLLYRFTFDTWTQGSGNLVCLGRATVRSATSRTLGLHGYWMDFPFAFAEALACAQRELPLHALIVMLHSG